MLSAMTAVLYLPCRRPPAGDDELHLLCPQPLPGTAVLAAWSSLDRLVAACGDAQPWVAVPTWSVTQLRDDAGAAAVVLDPPALSMDWS